jgi:hypothetical protein
VPHRDRPAGQLRTHITAIIVVPACLALGWWQVTRALDGNTLSWAYVFEWPIFAGYAVFMWWKLIHDPEAPASGPGPDPDAPDASRARTGDGSDVLTTDPSAPDQAEDEELASYNRYLAALHASGKRKHW